MNLDYGSGAFVFGVFAGLRTFYTQLSSWWREFSAASD